MCWEMASTCPSRTASWGCVWACAWAGVAWAHIRTLTCACDATCTFLSYSVWVFLHVFCVPPLFFLTHMEVRCARLCNALTGLVCWQLEKPPVARCTLIMFLCWNREMGRRWGWKRRRRRKNNERLCLRYSEQLCSTVCFDGMLEAFMKKQGHKSEPRPTGQRLKGGSLHVSHKDHFTISLSLKVFRGN